MSEITSFTIDIPQSDLDDLDERLARTRFTDPAPDPDYGVTLDYVRRLAEYWRDRYDWRAWEARLNAYPQFTTKIDGQNIHFVHVRSASPDAFPLILTHGWPGSVVEYLDVIDRLTDPVAHGAEATDAFHLVIPSLPGFGFSGPTSDGGWDSRRVARAWAELMSRLGYERYGAHGNDAGAMVSPELGRIAPEQVAGVHVTQAFAFPSGDPAEFAGLSAEEMSELGRLQAFRETRFSYNDLMSQQPQTIAHALADSPAGLLAWNGQLFGDWTQERALDDDFVVTNLAIYWFTNTAGSAARFYYENAKARQYPTSAPEAGPEPSSVPFGLAGFGGDFSGVRRFAERDHANVTQWTMHPEVGGHYAAHSEPDMMAADIRGFFHDLRQ